MRETYFASMRPHSEPGLNVFAFREFEEPIICRNDAGTLQQATQRMVSAMKDAPRAKPKTDEYCLPVFVESERLTLLYNAEQLKPENDHLIVRYHALEVTTDSGIIGHAGMESESAFSHVFEVLAAADGTGYSPGECVVLSVVAIHHPQGHGKTPIMTMKGDVIYGVHAKDIVARIRPVDETAEEMSLT